MKQLLVATLVALTVPAFSAQQPPVDLKKLDAIEPMVTEAIAEKKLPGAVVLIGRGDQVL